MAPSPSLEAEDDDSSGPSETEALLNETRTPASDDPSETMTSLPSSAGRLKRDNGLPESPVEVEVVLESLTEGEDADNAQLKAQGHEAALERRFSPLAALGLGFSITNSWVGYLSNFGQNMIYGGPQSVVFGLLVATIVQWIITLGLSEVASAFPSAGGQYHFTYIVAPTPHKKFAAFTVGWMTLLGWWVITCSGVSLCAISVSGMIQFWHPSYEAERWQTYLIYLATILLTGTVPVSGDPAPLFLSPKSVPKITQATLFLSVSGFLVIFCMLLGLKKRTQPGSFITQKGLGTSGWGDGMAWMLGIGNALYAYGGTDGAIHIAEEIPRPSKNIPKAIAKVPERLPTLAIGSPQNLQRRLREPFLGKLERLETNLTMLIGFSTAFPMSLALMFGIRDINAVLDSSLPSAEIFYQITGSKGIVTFMMSWVILVYYFSLTSQWVTAGRMTWAFARDHGIPFSTFFSLVSPSRDFPVRATVLSIAFCALYGLLYLASTTAFNSIVTGAVLYLSITYAVPQGIIATRGRATALPRRAFNLGPAGYICNVLAPLLVTVLGTFICFPPQRPVSVANMNYTPVILVGLFAVILGFWGTVGRRFEGPRIDWEGLRVEGCK
ncbi:hypothetical protein MMC21_007381 [Puttea exsequens]|nr:hypothetical protein [Puttea exsequens]